jgi:hypothetical protein
LRSALFVCRDQLTDCRVIVPQFKPHCAAATVDPKGFDYIRSDAFGGPNLFGSRAPVDDTSYAVYRWWSESNVPIISTWWWFMQIKLPRCAPNRDE